MATSSVPHIINNYIRSNAMSSLFLGGGLCCVVERKKYIHIPIVLLLPVPYCGDHIYKNRYCIHDEYKKMTG